MRLDIVNGIFHALNDDVGHSENTKIKLRWDRVKSR